MTNPATNWVKPTRLDYLPLNERLAVVRLSAQLTCDGWPRYPGLLVGAPHGSTRTLALGSVTHRVARRRAADELLWRVTFAVPLDLVQCPQALFGLVAAGYHATRLPDPWLARLTALCEPWPAGDHLNRFVSAALARRAAALGTALAVVGGGYAGPLAAAAVGRAHAPRAVVLAPRHPSRAATSLPQPASHPRRAAAAFSGSRAGSAAGGVVLSHHHSVDIAQRAARSVTDPAPAHHRGAGSHHHRSLMPAPGDHSHPGRDRHAHHRHGRAGGAAGEHRHPSGGAGLPTRQANPKPQPSPTPNPAPTPVPTSTSGGSTSGSSSWTTGEGANSSVAALLKRLSGLSIGTRRPPSFLIPIYKKAGAKYHIPWQVLAAINYVETDYGHDLNVSPAGAVGWMQFMPSTWREWGVAVGHTGSPNPYSPTDAIFSAAKYLAANGGGKHLRQAIFAYNHAAWYVDEVLLTAAQILEHTPRPGTGASAKIAAMKTAAQLLDGLPYVYGGGHAGWGPSVGYDCSGFVSAVLHAAGYLSGPVDTQTLPGQPGILSGPGKWVTIFDRTDGGSLSEDHVIIDIDGQFWESGGSTTSGGAPRVHQIKQMSLAYLATFNRILHPKGL